MPKTSPHHCDPVLVFFDGVCATCHWIVGFLLRRRNAERLRFMTLQSIEGTDFEKQMESVLSLNNKESIVVYRNGEVFARSAALLVIFSELGWPWNIFSIGKLIPNSLSDFFYSLFARNRYRIFGFAKQPDICEILPPHQRELVLNHLPEGIRITRFHSDGKFT